MLTRRALALLAALARQGVRRAELVDDSGRTVARVEGGVVAERGEG